MKVLKDNYKKNDYIEASTYVEPYPRKILCECCGSELEYEESDVHVGAFGCAYLTCPLCDSKTFVYDSEKEIALTKDNVEFPTHFYHTSKETGAVDSCNNKEVKKCIYKAIDYFRDNKDEYYWFTAYGNLYIIVFRLDGDECYEIMVTNNYYETSINFETIDYKA